MGKIWRKVRERYYPGLELINETVQEHDPIDDSVEIYTRERLPLDLTEQSVMRLIGIAHLPHLQLIVVGHRCMKCHDGRVNKFWAFETMLCGVKTVIQPLDSFKVLYNEGIFSSLRSRTPHDGI